MASLGAVSLILQGIPNKRTTVTVDGKVFFTALEFNQIPLGLEFSVKCEVMGEDSPDADDQLFVFNTLFIPTTNPNTPGHALGQLTNPEPVRFQTDLRNSVLNEDGGTDEIYARLTLKNLETGQVVKKRSPTKVKNF